MRNQFQSRNQSHIHHSASNIYNSYKLIAEFDAEDNNALLASYLWQPVGLDVPLMRIADNAEEYYIVDGNKNVIALKDSSGADVSTYTYTPFGAVEDPVDGDENPFRFSSEYHDDETNLVYYNYRYYSPELGRWLSRDPIEEEGGVNLYVMTGNNAIGYIDNLGLWAKVKPDDPNDFVYCAQKGDTLRGLAKQISGSELDYACLWPVSIKSPEGYPNMIQIQDKYDASNLEKKWNNKATLLITNDLGNPFGGQSIQATEIFDTIKTQSGQGGSPISYLLINGHMSATSIGGYVGGGKYARFTVAAYSSAAGAKEFDISFERASKKMGPKRCWFSRNAEVRFAGCNSSGFARDFARIALRRSATAYGTKYYIGVGNGIILYASELNVNNTWYPDNHDKGPKKSNDIFSNSIWEAHRGGL